MCLLCTVYMFTKKEVSFHLSRLKCWPSEEVFCTTIFVAFFEQSFISICKIGPFISLYSSFPEDIMSDFVAWLSVRCDFFSQVTGLRRKKEISSPEMVKTRSFFQETQPMELDGVSFYIFLIWVRSCRCCWLLNWKIRETKSGPKLPKPGIFFRSLDIKLKTFKAVNTQSFFPSVIIWSLFFYFLINLLFVKCPIRGQKTVSMKKKKRTKLITQMFFPSTISWISSFFCCLFTQRKPN